MLVSRGTLTKGRVLVCGTAYTRVRERMKEWLEQCEERFQVRTMTDERGKEVTEAKPGCPVSVSGKMLLKLMTTNRESK